MIFSLQKKILRIMAVAQLRTSCKSLFKQPEIPSLQWQYILSLMRSMINNQEVFQTNSSTHNIKTRNKHHLHRPNAKLSCFQKSIFYAGIKIFNSLPLSVTNLKNDKVKFIVALRKYLHSKSFYSVDEFVMHKNDL